MSFKSFLLEVDLINSSCPEQIDWFVTWFLSEINLDLIDSSCPKQIDWLTNLHAFPLKVYWEIIDIFRHCQHLEFRLIMHMFNRNWIFIYLMRMLLQISLVKSGLSSNHYWFLHFVVECLRRWRCIKRSVGICIWTNSMGLYPLAFFFWFNLYIMLSVCHTNLETELRETSNNIGQLLSI